MITWLEQLTSLPSISGHEEAVVGWVRRWASRRRDVRLATDASGNIVLTQSRRSARKPLWISAHMDHPGFLVTDVLPGGLLQYEFRGGVLDAYFPGARVELFCPDGRRKARVKTLERTGRYRGGLLKLTGSGPQPQKGVIGRWAFRNDQLGIRGGMLRAPGCDDLAGVSAALSAFDQLRKVSTAGNVGVLLTRAEEVGFIGAIAAAKGGTIPDGARLICVEMSRSFEDSPIGGGPIVRVGDASSVFTPALTGALATVASGLAQKDAGFTFQRKLMAGGSCEATAFMAYGYESTCLCLALGNYHNMGDLAAVEAGTAQARPAPEIISVADYEGLIRLLVAGAVGVDASRSDRLSKDLDRHFAEFSSVLNV